MPGRPPGKLKAAARALYSPQDERTPSAGGFDLGYLYAQQEVEVWPENWPAVALFIRMGTQWRVGITGATGLDYGVLFRLMDDDGLAGDERRLLLDDVQQLESAALARMREN